MPRYISQNEWASSIINVLDNLEDEGKQEIFDWIEKECYFHEPTRSELLETISILEGQLYDRDNEITELRCEIAELIEDDWK